MYSKLRSIHRFGSWGELSIFFPFSGYINDFNDRVISCFTTSFASVLVGFGATVNVAKPKKGQSVAIFGLGAVGLAVSCRCCFYVFFLLATRELLD